MCNCFFFFFLGQDLHMCLMGFEILLLFFFNFFLIKCDFWSRFLHLVFLLLNSCGGGVGLNGFPKKKNNKEHKYNFSHGGLVWERERERERVLEESRLGRQSLVLGLPKAIGDRRRLVVGHIWEMGRFVIWWVDEDWLCVTLLNF